ncbi:hypothetical protein ACFWY9_03750 [Amycolatopsis sp. NPDC059027]|uniref:hypothetical protein n=1 Tax=Amycolatopsis sp. NPDC059027 TaxID=3346709 RepID=UPI00366AAA90
MRTFVSRVVMAALSVAIIGGISAATAQSAHAAGWVEGKFIADTDIVAQPAPGAPVTGHGVSGSSVAVNCQTPDHNWYNVSSSGGSGWVWHPGQVETTNDSLIGIC